MNHNRPASVSAPEQQALGYGHSFGSEEYYQQRHDFFVQENPDYNPFGPSPQEQMNARQEQIAEQEKAKGRMKRIGGKVAGMFVRLGERRAAKAEKKAEIQAQQDERAFVEANKDNPSFMNDPRIIQAYGRRQNPNDPYRY